MQDGVTETRRIIETLPLAPALKHVVAHYRSDAAWRRVRPPMVALDPAAGDDLVAALEAEGFRFGRP